MLFLWLFVILSDLAWLLYGILLKNNAIDAVKIEENLNNLT